MLLLIACHFLGDFPFQPEFFVTNKGKSWEILFLSLCCLYRCSQSPIPCRKTDLARSATPWNHYPCGSNIYLEVRDHYTDESPYCDSKSWIGLSTLR